MASQKGKETNNKKIKRDDDDDNVAIWRKRFQCQDRHNKSCLDSGKKFVDLSLMYTCV